MAEKSRIDRITDRLKGALGLKKETSPKKDLSVAAESEAPKGSLPSPLLVADHEIENHLISRAAIEADAQKYRELVTSGQIDKYDPKFSAERNHSLQNDRFASLQLHELFRSADRHMCLIFGEILREAVAAHALHQKLGGSISSKSPVFGFDGLARTGAVISKIGINDVLPPLMPRSYFRGPILDRATVDQHANCILQIFRNRASDESNTETASFYNETREAVWSYVVEIAHDKMLDIQRAVKSEITMEREFDRVLVDFQKEFQGSSLSNLLAKGWFSTAKITDKLQADSLFVSGEPINDGFLPRIPEIAVGFNERISDALLRKAS